MARCQAISSTPIEAVASEYFFTNIAQIEGDTTGVFMPKFAAVTALMVARRNKGSVKRNPLNVAQRHTKA